MTALVFALPGSLYLYQGEEFGLAEVLDIADDRRTDPIFELTNGEEVGRDGSRVPIPWTDDPATSFGFSTPRDDGSVGEPWLPQPDGWAERSLVRQEEDADSTLQLYRELAEVRRAHARPQPLSAEVVDVAPGLVVVRRGGLAVVVNTTDRPIALDLDHAAFESTEPVFASEPTEMHTPGVIPADSTLWLVG